MDNGVKLDKWNIVKKDIDRQRIKKQVENQGIYWISIGQNVGSEVYGKGRDFVRPVLVLCVFFNHTFLGVPLSSKFRNKTGRLYYKFKDSKGRLQVALLGQMRTFDTRRKANYISKINDNDFAKLKEKIKSEIIV